MTQCRAGELGEESLDQVEPGAVLGREGKFETTVRLGGEPGLRLLGDVSRVIVEDQLDRGVGRIGGVEEFQELDELAAAMAVPDQGMDFTGEEINPSQQTERAVALVLKVTREARMHARYWRQIRCCVRDRLDTRLLVVADDRHRLSLLF